MIRTLTAQTRRPGFKTAGFSYLLITMYDTPKITRQSELWRSTVVLCERVNQFLNSFLILFCVQGCAVESVSTS